MTLSSSGFCAQLLHCLAEPALRALALAALAGLALALGRAKDAAVRLAVWTAVLYAALAMPFLARVAPAVRLPLPSRLTAHSVLAPAPGGIRTVATASPLRVIAAPSRVGAALVAAPASAGQPQGQPLRRAEPSQSHWTFSWPLVAVALYLLLAGILLGQVATGFYFSRRIKLFSNPVGDRRVLAMLLEQSTRWGLHTAPGLAESAAVTVPVTLGAWHPIVLLPTAWRAWSEEKIQAALAHELSHVVRKDALTRALAAIHRSVFWFSPLAWWLERHLAALAEQASDDAALRTGADRVFYAKVLLGFYQDLQSAIGRVRWEGVAMTRGKQAQRRVDRILDSSRRLSAGLRKSAWLALALLAAPVIYLLAGAQPIVAHKLHGEDGRVLAAPVTSPAAEPLWAGLQAPPTPAAPKPVAAPPQAPQAPTPPPATAGQWVYPESDEDVMIFYGKEMSGTGTYRDSDLKHLRALRDASKADIVWFRRNGKAYIIRDAATVQQAKGIWAPQEAQLDKLKEELLRQQGALSAQQEAPGTQGALYRQMEALRAQQEALGKQMEKVRVPVPDLTAELQKLQAQLDQLHKHGATQEELGEAQNALRDLQTKLATGKLGAFGGEEGELGAQQAEMGDLQRKLGELGRLRAQFDQLNNRSTTQEELGEAQNALRDLRNKLATGKLGAIVGKEGEAGAQQAEMGDLQRKLGEQQARLEKEASRKMKALLDDALAKGLAQPE
jgi:beta-lactamase regulating signal transducer with metallopeptidase domain